MDMGNKLNNFKSEVKSALNDIKALSKREILLIAIYILGVCIVLAAIIWLLCNFVPLMIGVILFIPWLLSALSDGGSV